MSVRFKYYLRGCGCGILIASLIFIISLHARGGIITDEKAMQRASELGMVMPDTQEETQTLFEETEDTEIPVKETNIPDTQRTTEKVTHGNLDKSSEEDTTGQEQKDTEKNTGTETQSDTQKDTEKKTTDTQKSSEPASSQKDTEKTSQSTEDKKDDTVSFTIKSGQVCRIIAENLQAEGLIDDAEEFRKYMKDHNYANYIRVGTFELKKGMDYAEIAKILTRR